MSDNPTLDQLVQIRGKLEQEIAQVRSLLAGRNKAMESLNSTIELLRGWEHMDLPEPTDTKRSSPRQYDDDAMVDGITNFFLAKGSDAKVPIRDITAHLRSLGLAGDDDKAKAKVNQLLRTKLNGVVDVVGASTKARWFLTSAVTGK